MNISVPELKQRWLLFPNNPAIKISDLMQLGEDVGLMNPAATFGCPFCLEPKGNWGLPDNEQEPPKFRTSLFPSTSPPSNSLEAALIERIVSERGTYQELLGSKTKSGDITDDQKQKTHFCLWCLSEGCF